MLPEEGPGRESRGGSGTTSRLNGSDLRVPIDGAFDLLTSIADGSLRDVLDIAVRLGGWVVDLELER